MNYGRYQIVKEVGRGSMGVVYQARDPHIDRLVAVKVLRQDRVTSEDFVKRFLKEARVIGRLTHSNIVAIYDVGEEQGTVYIAMEFLEGISLSDVIKEKLPDLNKVVALGIQLAQTLDYAHQKGVVHRDIKPSNIIVQSDGQIKITDFGIAHVEDATATLQTQAGDIMGTPSYMSPEQVLSHPVDGRTDIFSLGIILYELTTGRRPFGGGGKSLMTVLNEVVEFVPQEPDAAMPSVPGELSRLIMKALQKDPAKRFQTGKELAEALRRCLDGAAPVSAIVPSPPANNRKNLMLAVALVAVLTVVGGGYFFFSRQGETHKAVPLAKSGISPNVPKITSPTLPESARTEPSAPLPKIPNAPSLAPSTVERPVAMPRVPSRGDAIVPVETHKASKTPGLSSKESGKASSTTDTPKHPVAGAKAPPAKTKPAVYEPQTQPSVTRIPELPSLNSPAKPMSRFAFLKVGSTPSGARVFINGTQKGITPMILKLDFGQYQVRLSRSGYQDVERQIKLDRMTEYPLLEELKPAE